MKKYKYDLHIHTTLSPCAEDMCTPNNILNVAMLAELDFIAITDHNTTLQIDAINEIAKSYDFVVIPGIEVSVESFHVLVYFRDTKDAHSFNQDLSQYFIKKNIDNEYLKQQLLDEYDQEVDVLQDDLMSIDVSYNDFSKLARKYDSIICLAHIDRYSTSVLNKYKDLDKLDFDLIEFSRYAKEDFINQYKKYKYIQNTDSHSVIDIGILNNYIELKEKTIDCLFKVLKC